MKTLQNNNTVYNVLANFSNVYSEQDKAREILSGILDRLTDSNYIGDYVGDIAWSLTDGESEDADND